MEALDQTEDYLLRAARTDDGLFLDEEAVERLLSLPCRLGPERAWDGGAFLDARTQELRAEIEHAVSERNLQFFRDEESKLDGWAEDLKVGLEREIKDLDREIRDTKRASTSAATLEQKLPLQRQVKALESQRNQKRRSLFEAQDQIDHRRDELIGSIERKLESATTVRQLYAARFFVMG